MPHPYAGETAPIPVRDLARPQQQGWLSFGGQYEPTRQAAPKRRPYDRARKGRAAKRG